MSELGDCPGLINQHTRQHVRRQRWAWSGRRPVPGQRTAGQVLRMIEGTGMVRPVGYYCINCDKEWTDA